jgi:hypothetical protein
MGGGCSKNAEMRNKYEALIGNSKRKTTWRPKGRWKHNIKMGLE